MYIYKNKKGVTMKKKESNSPVNTQPKKKKKKWIVIIIVVIIILIIIGAAASGGGDTSKTSNQTSVSEQEAREPNQNTQKDEGQTEEDPKESATEHFETDLTSGHYIAGVDIPSGTYNITVTSGNGNVSSSNMYSGGINEAMSTEADDLYIDSFNNLKLPEGETLSLGGTITLHLVSEDAQTGKLQERTIGDETKTDLSSGNYVAGTDFPAGVYNVVSTGNAGNVSSDNMYEGGLNEILGDGSDGLSVKQVNNVELPKGTTLTISGTSIQLIPVGSAK